MPIFRSIRLYTLYTTAYGVQLCKRELCVSGWFHFMLFVVLCNCWLRLCCMLYWVLVLHNTCYAHWSGWKCRGGAGVPETCRVIYDNKKNCCIKLVPLVIFIHDVRTHIYQIKCCLYTVLCFHIVHSV